jgi:hypothetical protein
LGLAPARPLAPVAFAAPATERTGGASSGDHVTEAGRSTSSVSSPPAARADPTGGQLVIDGIVLGRWIGERLARAATRPPAGGTAFDPRISPAWPGAPIGA